MQQSTHWNPPPQQQHPLRGGGPPPGRYPSNGRPFGRGGVGPSLPRGGGGVGRMNGSVRGIGRGRGRFGTPDLRGPLREPKSNFGRGGPRGPGPAFNQTKPYPSGKQIKSPPRGQAAVSRQPSKPATDFKGDLEKYFTQNNLGEVPYKVAAVGTKGKEKYMATVTVEGTQFKTYPQTYNSRVRKHYYYY